MTEPEDLDLGPPIRAALLEAENIAGELGLYKEKPAIFTRRPVPEEASDPIIIINPDAAISDEDALNSERPIVMRDIAIYGVKAAPADPADQSRLVEALGYRVRKLFHRQKFSIRPEGFSVIEIIATGPIVAPVDDEATVGRIVSLTVRLRREPQ